MSGLNILQQPTPPPESTSVMKSTCTHCGNNIPTTDEASHRIKDLEAQVRLLNTKASAAVDKIADYEDEIRSLRTACAKLQQEKLDQPQSQLPQQPQQPQQPPPPTQLQPTVPSPPPINQTSNTPILTPTPITTPNPSSPPRSQSRLASLSSFLPGRKRDTALLQQPPNTPSTGSFPQNALQPLLNSNSLLDHTSTPEPPYQPQQPLTLLSLQASLENERSLRLRAESNLTQTQTELEELTASLFGQANEMVAEERKARAKLEERVKVLEDRDGEKKKRLERLERALERIERVRGLVGKRGDGEIRIAFGAVGDVGVEKDRLRVVNDVSVRG